MSVSGSVAVRRICSDDAELLRSIRLAALANDPQAFARTHDEESILEAGEWRFKAKAWADGREEATFFASIHGEVVGLVGAHRLGPATGVELVSMWVSPSVRGHGVGAALVSAVVEWADGDTIELWVMRGNGAAEALYERCGFSVTRDVQALESDPCRDEIRMRRSE